MTSHQILLNFTGDKLKGKWPVNILSVFNDKLLVGSTKLFLHQLFITSREGLHYSTIQISTSYESPYDATWTPLGNILYTLASTGMVVLISESGKFITENTKMIRPRGLSVSYDNIIHLVDSLGVYQSTDDGVSWSLVFNLPEEASCWHAIKVNANYSEDYWTFEEWTDKSYKSNYRVRVYSVTKRLPDSSVKWKDVNFIAGKHVDNRILNKLSFYDNKNIVLTNHENKTVNLLSVNDQYNCQLLSFNQINSHPWITVADKKRSLLYIGLDYAIVSVFKLSCAIGWSDISGCCPA